MCRYCGADPRAKAKARSSRCRCGVIDPRAAAVAEGIERPAITDAVQRPAPAVTQGLPTHLFLVVLHAAFGQLHLAGGEVHAEAFGLPGIAHHRVAVVADQREVAFLPAERERGGAHRPAARAGERVQPYPQCAALDGHAGAFGQCIAEHRRVRPRNERVVLRGQHVTGRSREGDGEDARVAVIRRRPEPIVLDDVAWVLLAQHQRKVGAPVLVEVAFDPVFQRPAGRYETLGLGGVRGHGGIAHRRHVQCFDGEGQRGQRRSKDEKAHCSLHGRAAEDSGAPAGPLYRACGFKRT